MNRAIAAVLAVALVTPAAAEPPSDSPPSDGPPNPAPADSPSDVAPSPPPPAAQPPAPALPLRLPLPLPPPPPVLARTPCDVTTFYLEPTLVIADDGTNAKPLHRIAGGAQIHDCLPDGAGRFAGRLGVTAYLSGIEHASAGVGIEAELDFAASRSSDRIGVRIGYESAEDTGRLYTAGVRYRPGIASLGIDAFYVGNTSATVTGVMFGFGLEGKPGRYVVATEAIVAAGLLALLLLACSGGSCFGSG